MNLVIIANCQVQPLEKLLKMSPEVDSIISIPIHLIGNTLYENSVTAFNELIKRDSNALIISFPLSTDFKDFETNELRRRFTNVKTINNIFFTGLHPDITYLSDIGKRIPSPVGDYHSKIILYSYLQNYPLEKCLSYFCKTSYEQMGYFDEFESSRHELLMREQDVDIKFGEKYLSLVKKNHSMFTFNHPTSFIFHNWAKEISDFIGTSFYSPDPFMEQNYLSSNTWWPVYPEITDSLSCDYKGSYVFKQNDSCGGKFMTLEKMIELSYITYRENDNVLRSSRQAIAIIDKFNKKTNV
jgi:hypothetical protein